MNIDEKVERKENKLKISLEKRRKSEVSKDLVFRFSSKEAYN